MAVTNLFVNTSGNGLVAGTNNPSGVAATGIPLFCPDTGTILNIWLLKLINPAPASGVNPFSILLPAGLTLYFYLNDGTVNGTIYASCIAFAPDPTGQFFTGSLQLNTAALENLMGASQSAQCTMMIGYISGGLQTTVLSAPTTITAGIPTNVVAPVPAGEVALSQQQAAQTYVPLLGRAGQSQEVVSKNGHQWVLLTIDNPDGTCKPPTWTQIS